LSVRKPTRKIQTIRADRAIVASSASSQNLRSIGKYRVRDHAPTKNRKLPYHAVTMFNE